MRIAVVAEALRADLLRLAAVGGEPTGAGGAGAVAAVAAAAERLAAALEPALVPRLLEVAGQFALDASAELPEGRFEVRLVGVDPELVYVAEEPAGGGGVPGADSASAAGAARLTLRLPEPVKARVEAAAAREGVSTNTWVVRALARATGPDHPVPSGRRLSGFGRA